MDKIQWGILSTANIGVKKVIPALQQSRYGEVAAIASRSGESDREAADQLNISTAYASYEKLLQDAQIDAVYIPLPNHLHVPWAIKALEAGKHVLCEKPIGLSAAEARQLQQKAAQYPHLKVMEAFMYRFHPQWKNARQLIDEGSIGTLKTIHSFFSYFNNDPENVRNKPNIGGGGLMDIGCYNISLSRYLFDDEPKRVVGHLEFDPDFKVDRLASGIMKFGAGTATFTCATQLNPDQRVTIYGTSGRIEIDIPFNMPPDQPATIWVHSGDDKEKIIVDPANQFTLEGDAFARAILDDTDVPTPLDDAVHNMDVIDSIFESASRIPS
jgi:predicted dehydrogenase